MTEFSLVLVDTNVIIDIVEKDPIWESWSRQQMATFSDCLTINPIIYAELSDGAHSSDDVDNILTFLRLRYLELPRPALYLASKAFRQYRQRGGIKTAPLADFFIGAHATVLDIPILTRDATRYHSYFPTVKVIAPVT